MNRPLARFPSILAATFPWGLAGLLLAASPVAQTVKLNGPLPRQIVGRVQSFVFSADGTSMVYLADERTDQVFELFSAPSDGSAAALTISGTLVAGGDVSTLLGFDPQDTFRLLPDGSSAVFVGDKDTNDVFELYGVPIDGSSAPVKLSGTLAAGGDITPGTTGAGLAASGFEISADGSRVVFLADKSTDGVVELYSVPSDGSAPAVKLNGALVAGGNVKLFLIGAQSGRVYYLADQAIDGVLQLYSVPIDGSAAAVRLNDALVAGRNVADFRVALDESRAVYRADQAADDVLELFSVPADGSAAAVKLSTTPVSGGDVATFEIDSDGMRVVYRADQDTNNTVELYSVPIDASAAPTKLHPATKPVSTFWITPDAGTVVFQGQLSTTNDLYRVPITGGTPVKLNGNLIPSSNTVAGVMPSADSQLFLYSQRTDPFMSTAHSEDLYVASLSGGAPTRLTNNPQDGGSNTMYTARFVPNGDRVVYVYTELAGVTRLYTVPQDASQAPAVVATSGTAFALASDGSRLAFVGEGNSPGRLFSASVAGSGLVPVSGPALEGPVVGDVSDIQPTSDGTRVVYRVTALNGNDSLYAVGTGGGSTPVPLFAPEETIRHVPLGAFTISPENDRVAYLAQDPIDGHYDLVGAHLRGAAPVVDLNLHAVDGPTLATFPGLKPEFTPDGQSVLYASGTESFGSFDLGLFVVPADGSAAPTRLNGTSTDLYLWDGSSSSAADRAFRVAPGGQRVVYSASSGPPWHNLFSVPVDGSSAPVKLTNITTVAGASIYGNWALTPDGNRAVYIADQEVRLRSELYSVPVDGSSAPVKLNPALVAGGKVGSYQEGAGFSPYAQITPDSARVVYQADQEVDERNDLFSVPTGGGTSVKLSGSLVNGGDVVSFFDLDPDGTRVVFAADKDIDEVYELYSAPVDGSAAPVKLSGGMVASGDVQTALNSSNLRVHFGQGRVVFVADKDTNDVIELYSAPVDGSAAPVKLNGTMATGGDVVTASIFVTPDGSTVFYRADQDADEVFALYSVPIDGSAAPTKINPTLPAGGDVMAAAMTRSFRVEYVADQDLDEQFELYTLRLIPLVPKKTLAPRDSRPTTRTQ